MAEPLRVLERAASRWPAAWIGAHAVMGAALSLASTGVVRALGDGSLVAVPVLFGLTLGVVQWLLLRGWLARGGWWIAATLTALAGAAFTSWVGPRLWTPLGSTRAQWYGIVTGTVSGVLVSLAQAAVLHRQRDGGRRLARRWAAFSSLGWGARSLLANLLLFNTFPPPASLETRAGAWLLQHAAIGSLGWAAYASVSAVALIQRPCSAATAPTQAP